jgi:leucyl/phenylalanyl-tRNA--protein transferase
VGGLYGVTLGSGFFGESMFSLIPSASKIALIMLARLMKQLGNSLIDCQFETPHLKTMGGRYIDYDEYLKLIRRRAGNSRVSVFMIRNIKELLNFQT